MGVRRLDLRRSVSFAVPHEAPGRISNHPAPPSGPATRNLNPTSLSSLTGNDRREHEDTDLQRLSSGRGNMNLLLHFACLSPSSSWHGTVDSRCLPEQCFCPSAKCRRRPPPWSRSPPLQKMILRGRAQARPRRFFFKIRNIRGGRIDDHNS